MTIECEHVGEMELILPQNPEIGLTIKIEANRPLNVRIHPRGLRLNDLSALSNPDEVENDN